MIAPELHRFLESGISILVGTRDARCMPACMRAIGARVENAGTELAVFLPAATAARTLANLRDNGRIAVCFGRPRDHHSVQVKGRLLDLRAADAAERAWVDRYREGLAESLGHIGLPTATTLRLMHWPCMVARVRIEQLYEQTPGPRAGQPLPASAAEARP